MIITKNGKQLSTRNYNNYRVLSGTVDNKNPKALYLTISAWGKTLINEDVDYAAVIRSINKDIKKALTENLNQNLFYTDRCIVDFDMRESGITYGKKSYMNCEVTLYQKNLFKLQEKTIQNELNDMSKIITKDILENVKYFTFSKTKK
tara:strand:+ start:32053 stop:32496 length:444 start_codon:yes stop_codon:yes gene_type:complete